MKRPPKILKTLLSIKTLYEERAQERLGTALSAFRATEKDLQEITALQKDLFSRLEGAVLSGKDLFLYGQGLEATFREQTRLQEKYIARQKEIESLRKELERAHREKKTVEKICQKQWQKYLQEEERIFWKELDDLTVMRKGRS